MLKFGQRPGKVKPGCAAWQGRAARLPNRTDWRQISSMTEEKPDPTKPVAEPTPPKPQPPKLPPEIGGPKGPEPTRYGDWERDGRCTDF